MGLKKQIQELERRFQMEWPHTRQVTRLALAVFDGLAPCPELRKKDRDILLAAGRLHDIGYADDPERHVDRGIDILLENPLPAISEKRWKMVVAVVALHRRDWRRALQDKRLASLSEKRWARAKALGAILRIGDGLDHSHVQDARICSCRRKSGFDEVKVECGWYAGNVSWAEGKADLWKAVFGHSLKLKGSVLHGGLAYTTILNGNESPIDAARKMLYSQYDVMRDQWPAINDKRDKNALQTYVQAFRRFRGVLHLFMPLLDTTSARRVGESLDALERQLNPLWGRIMIRKWVNDLSEVEGIARVQKQCVKDAKRADEKICSILDSAACQDALQAIRWLLRVELPACGRDMIIDPAPVYKQLDSVRAKLRKQKIESMVETSAGLDQIHDLCSRSLYMTECAVVLSEQPEDSEVSSVQRIVSALDRLRGFQRAIEVLEADKPKLAQSPELIRARDAERRAFAQAWNEWDLI